MALNPQQQAFKEAYCNPNSSTFGMVTESGVAAGFARDYAEQLTSPSLGLRWVSEIISDLKRLEKAEKVLDKTLDYEVERNGQIDNQLLAIQNKTAMFIAETAGRAKYSKRTETDITTLGQSINEPMTTGEATAAKAYEEAMKKALLE